MEARPGDEISRVSRPAAGGAGGVAATLRSTFAAAWCSSAWRSAHADRGWLGLGASDGGDSRANPGSIRVVAKCRAKSCVNYSSGPTYFRRSWPEVSVRGD